MLHRIAAILLLLGVFDHSWGQNAASCPEDKPETGDSWTVPIAQGQECTYETCCYNQEKDECFCKMTDGCIASPNGTFTCFSNGLCDDEDLLPKTDDGLCPPQLECRCEEYPFLYTEELNTSCEELCQGKGQGNATKATCVCPDEGTVAEDPSDDTVNCTYSCESESRTYFSVGNALTLCPCGQTEIGFISCDEMCEAKGLPTAQYLCLCPDEQNVYESSEPCSDELASDPNNCPPTIAATSLEAAPVLTAVSSDPPIVCPCPDGTNTYESSESAGCTDELAADNCDPSLCPKDEEGGNVNAVFDESQECFKCRKLNAKKDENGCFDLNFTLFNRGVIEVFACPPTNLTFYMTGADTTTPFTLAEKSFFTKTANEIRANTPVDLNISGTLDLFSALASEALAVWPQSEFPINHVYPTPTPPYWFDQDELLKEEQCPGDGSGTAPTQAAPMPTQAAPTFFKISPSALQTEPPVMAPAPTQVAPTPRAWRTEPPTYPPSSSPSAACSGAYSMAEVRKHNTDEDAWIVVDGRVYDVTDYITAPFHINLLIAGEDNTEDFKERQTHVDNDLLSLVECKGVLIATESPSAFPPGDESGTAPTQSATTPTQAVPTFDRISPSALQTEPPVTPTQVAPPAPTPVLGGDRDEHGCIPSAGESWCPDLEACIQPWITDCPNCTGSGGTVDTSSCCLSSGDFPNNCLIGPCGCSPQASHEVKVCNCPENKCFNGTMCDDDERFLSLTQAAPTPAQAAPTTQAAPTPTQADPLPTASGRTPAPTGCVKVCHVEGTTTASGSHSISFQLLCLPPNDVQAHLDQHGCDWEYGEGCECEPDRMDMGMFNECSPDACPPIPSGRLGPDGVVQPAVPTPAPTGRVQVCSVLYEGDGIRMSSNFFLPAVAADLIGGNDCAWEITDDCPCFEVDKIDTCAPDCPSPGGRKLMGA